MAAAASELVCALYAFTIFVTCRCSIASTDASDRATLVAHSSKLALLAPFAASSVLIALPILASNGASLALRGIGFDIHLWVTTFFALVRQTCVAIACGHGSFRARLITLVTPETWLATDLALAIGFFASTIFTSITARMLAVWSEPLVVLALSADACVLRTTCLPCVVLATFWARLVASWSPIIGITLNIAVTSWQELAARIFVSHEIIEHHARRAAWWALRGAVLAIPTIFALVAFAAASTKTFCCVLAILWARVLTRQAIEAIFTSLAFTAFVGHH